MITTLQVALGGALGATLRYFAGLGVLRVFGPSPFPVATLGVNVLGSFFMGLFVIWVAERSAGSYSPFLMTGLLGGFTTFSAFSLDAVALYERGELGLAGLYVTASVLLSIAGLVLGMLVARGVLT